MSIIGKSQLAKEGFTCLAGPFQPFEEYMIPSFIKDAVAANKDVAQENTRKGVYLWHRSKLGR